MMPPDSSNGAARHSCHLHSSDLAANYSCRTRPAVARVCKFETLLTDPKAPETASPVGRRIMARSMNQPGFLFFLGLTAIVAALSAVLAYAVLRFIVAARNITRGRRRQRR